MSFTRHTYTVPAQRACHSRLRLFALLPLFIPAIACNSSGNSSGFGLFNKENTAPPPLEPNVLAVHLYATPTPWLKFKPEPDRKPDGLKLTLFLESTERTGKKVQGVRGDGLIEIALYRINRAATDAPPEQQVKSWQFDANQALPWLVRNRTGYGWGYGFRLNWEDAQVRGHEIRLQARFKRRDGAVLASAPVSLRVPEVVQ